MSVDKLVDSTQLDTDLTSIANAIRTKGGTSASLAFPAGFVSAIGDIPTGGGSLKYEIGDFTLASDKQYMTDTGGISHGLGVVPKCVIVWQSTYTGSNIPTVQVNSGYVFLDRIMDMNQRLSSSASYANGLYVSATIAANTSVGFQMVSPTSDSYMPRDAYKPTSSTFFLYNTGTNNRWRANVQYHYFVSEAWWT